MQSRLYSDSLILRFNIVLAQRRKPIDGDCLAFITNMLHYRVVLCVLDQFLLETEPDETETIMRHLGTAVPLQVNLAISGVERLTREVRAAVQRRQREETSARRAAIGVLHCELNGTVTALLLCCELALRTPNLSSDAADQIESAHELVKKLRAQLESSLVEA